MGEIIGHLGDGADEPDLPGALLRRLNGQPVYVHLDCDVLEPGLVPTDFQVPGGLSLERLATAMEALATHPIVGLEVAEFQTGWSPDEQGAATAVLLQAMLPLLNAVRDAILNAISELSTSCELPSYTVTIVWTTG